MDRRSALGTLAALAAIQPLAGHAQDRKAGENGAMIARKIPSSGELLPVIGLGTWQTFDVPAGESARAPLAAVLREFVLLGGSLIDSSPMYGRAEEVAGELMAKLSLREKLFVATKVWTSGKAAGTAQMEDSLRKLRIAPANAGKPLDLMQVHNLLDVDTHLRTLADWKQAGRVRYVGVTHYTPSAYDAVEKVIATHTVDFLQINYSVGEREAERRLLPMARERGIAVIINRPFAGGELLRGLQGKPLPGFAAELDCSSWPQLLLKFVISHPGVTCAIPATSRLEHLRDNMAAGSGRLPDEKLRMQIAASLA